MKFPAIDTRQVKFATHDESPIKVGSSEVDVMREYRRQLLQYIARRRNGWNQGTSSEEMGRLYEGDIDRLSAEADRVKRMIDGYDAWVQEQENKRA